MTEAELERLASGLGRKAARGVDEARVARAVLERLAIAGAPRTLRRRLRPVALVALALAALLLLVLRPAFRGATGTPVARDSGALTVLPELDNLTVSQLETLLETLPPLATEAEHPDAASFEEMDAKNLERLLRSLEG